MEKIKVYLIHRVPGMSPGTMSGSELEGVFMRGDTAGMVVKEDDTGRVYWIPSTGIAAVEVIEILESTDG